MRVVALLTVRNEALFLDRCLRHLAAEGVETWVVDNDSTDDSRAIAEAQVGRGVIRVERLPYRGSFELATILGNEERLAAEIPGDWFIHHDADEIREAPEPYATLADGLAAADRMGANAVHFDEFVFLPSGDESYEGTDYVARMDRYYFFEPAPLRRVNAWKRRPGVAVDLTTWGGHQVTFAGREIFPTPFVMRHYIALSRAHAIAKYGSRVYSSREVAERGWHGPRASFAASRLRLPERERLKRKAPGAAWDRSDPWRRHELFGDSP